MNRQSALVLIILFFFLFNILCYYGVKITIVSSLAFSTFVSLILLCLFYPPSMITTDEADFTLVVYSIIVILGIIFLAFYIAYTTLMDIRCEC
jgi:hypothetical protein